MTISNSGLLLVPFPFTQSDNSQEKTCAIISSRKYNSDQPDFIIMAITIRLHQVDKLGKKLVSDWQEAGLIRPSVFNPIRATIDNTLVIKQLGSLQQEDRHSLSLILQNILGSK